MPQKPMRGKEFRTKSSEITIALFNVWRMPRESNKMKLHIGGQRRESFWRLDVMKKLHLPEEKQPVWRIHLHP